MQWKPRYDYHDNFRKNGITAPPIELIMRKCIIDISYNIYFACKFSAVSFNKSSDLHYANKYAQILTTVPPRKNIPTKIISM